MHTQRFEIRSTPKTLRMVIAKQLKGNQVSKACYMKVSVDVECVILAM